MPRQTEQYHILIGKDKQGDYVFLDEAFKYGDGLQGLCGTRMLFHTEEEYEEAKQNYLDSDDLLYLRKEAVQAGNTEQGYQDRLEDVVKADEGLVYDESYRCSYRIDDALEIIDKHEYEETGIHKTSEFSDCVGGGRCFDKEMLNRNYRNRVEEENFSKFKELYEKYEKPNDDKLILEKAHKRFVELYEAKVFDEEEAQKIRRFLKNNNIKFAEKFLKNRERNCESSFDLEKKDFVLQKK